MRTSISGAIALAGALAGTSAPAAADCHRTPYRYHFQNEVVVSRVLIQGGRTCILLQRAFGTSRFTDFAIVERPHHGSLVESEAYSTLYTADAGYKGDDAYAVRICGRNRTRCSTVRYLTTIE